MTFTATPITAALAGAFSGVVMPLLWPHLGEDSLTWIAAFLLVIALPAHACVVGFNRPQASGAGAMDTALLTRVGVWLLAAVLAAAAVSVFSRGAP
jgi:hypothetical protein